MPVDRQPAQPTLTDGVVTLRPWTLADVDRVHPLEDEQMVRWFGFPRPSTRDDLAAAVHRWHAAYAADRSTVNFVVTTPDDGPVGTVEVRVRGHDNVGDVSWTTYAPYRRRGFATRAVRLLATYAFDALHLTRLEALVEPVNAASVRLARAAGFQRASLLTSNENIGGQRRDQLLFSLARESFRAHASDDVGYVQLTTDGASRGPRYLPMPRKTRAPVDSRIDPDAVLGSLAEEGAPVVSEVTLESATRDHEINSRCNLVPGLRSES